MLSADDLSAFPNFGDVDLIDPIAPRVPDLVHGLVVEVPVRQLEQVPTAELPELPILGLETLEERRREGSLQVFSQEGVRIVLISKVWGRLTKGHTLLNLAETDVG
jgi:hypothetical protein